jgi:creatinine amidohydrolase
MPSRYWHDMTTLDFERFQPGRLIAVLPVGAIESHGPHLPVNVDSCIIDGIVARAIELMPADLPAFILPTQPVGKSNEHIAFPGTLTLSAETLIRLWTEIGESVGRAGCRKLVLFNSHGGQPEIMEIVARDLRVRKNMFVVTSSWYGFGIPDGLFAFPEIKHGIHGGGVETSMMLHLRPDLVRLEKAADFKSHNARMAQEYKMLWPAGPARWGWQSQDLHESGAAGNAADSDAKRGAVIIEHAARKFIELLAEVERYPLSNLKAR